MTVANEKTDTGTRLDWQTAVRSDRRIGNAAFRFASYVAHRFNAKKGKAYFSDETAGEELNMKRSTLGRCRKELQDAGYLTFRPGRGMLATEYVLLHDRVSGMLDMLLVMREDREEARAKRENTRLRELREASKAVSSHPSSASELQHKNTANAAILQRSMRQI